MLTSTASCEHCLQHISQCELNLGRVTCTNTLLTNCVGTLHKERRWHRWSADRRPPCPLSRRACACGRPADTYQKAIMSVEGRVIAATIERFKGEWAKKTFVRQMLPTYLAFLGPRGATTNREHYIQHDSKGTDTTFSLVATTVAMSLFSTEQRAGTLPEETCFRESPLNLFRSAVPMWGQSTWSYNHI